ncbi:retrovirus-related pol polyprotein from transposon TNT 1-94, partial [Tanacetum coccineum]
DHPKKDCLKRNKKKSTGFVKKNVGQGFGMYSEGHDNGDLLMAVSEKMFLELIMNFGGSYHMTPRRDFLFDFKDFNGGTLLLGINKACAIRGTWKVRVQMKDGSSFMLENMRYILELKRSLISLGTLDREGYTVKLQNGRVKVIKGSLMVLFETMKENYVYSLDGWAESGEANVGIHEKESLAQVWHKRLAHISEAGLHELERRDVLGNKGLGFGFIFLDTRMRRSASSRSRSSWWKTRQVSIYNIGEKETYGFMVRTFGELRDVEDNWLRCLFTHESEEAQA